MSDMIRCQCPLHTLYPMRIADLVNPTFADRKAACDLIGNDTYGNPWWTPETINNCNPVVQAFARHAIAALPAAQPAPEMRFETTEEHIARDMREGRFPAQSERQMVPVDPQPAPVPYVAPTTDYEAVAMMAADGDADPIGTAQMNYPHLFLPQPAPVTVERKGFPILGSQGATIDWQLVADHGEQAKHNHYQTVEKLAERGGLSWSELCAVLHNKPFQKIDSNEAMISCRALEAQYLRALAGEKP